MNSDILLDLQATINYPKFRWPSDKNGSIEINGYKYKLTVDIEDFFVPSFSFSIQDSDELPIETDSGTVMCVRDWIATNVLPHYLQLN